MRTFVVMLAAGREAKCDPMWDPNISRISVRGNPPRDTDLRPLTLPAEGGGTLRCARLAAPRL